MPEIIDRGAFDPADYEQELSAAPGNHEVGTKLLYENDRVGIWEVRLGPGERAAFHIHDKSYFWTVVEPGIGRQRLADGSYLVQRYEDGETLFMPYSSEEYVIHDIENCGDTRLRFITVELYD